MKLRAQFSQPSYSVSKALHKACPDYVFANADDYAYAVFLPDSQSLKAILTNLRYEKDVFTRTLLWGGLYDSMHFAETNPRDYVQAALSELPSEQEETLVRSITGRTIVALHDYLTDQELTSSFESLAYQRLKNAATQGQRIIWFRTFVAAAQSGTSLAELKNLLRGADRVPDVEFRSLDRWRMITKLLAASDKDSLELFGAERENDKSGIGQKYAYVAVAARPGSSNKSFYFDDYLHNRDRSEDWVQDSLPSFNQWNQSEVTFEYLRPALDALPQIKQQRKIFFLVAWLDAFIGGQHSAEASHQVYDWLAGNPTDPDLRLKILQAVDELDRTVQIRAKYR